MQQEHRVSDWYTETDTRLKELDLEFTGDNRDAFLKITESFRLSNRRRCDESQAVEAEITKALSTLTGDADAATLDKIAKLIARRDLLLRQMLNKKRD